MATTSLDANKKIARQTFEAFEKKDLTVFDKLCDASKYKLHFPGIANPLNLEDAKDLNKEYMTAFPDAKVTIDLQIAEGEYVCTKLTYRGTNKGELQGNPASNKKVTTTGTSVQRIVNGKIVEEWTELDALGMMQQIGAMPEMANQNNM